MTRPARVLIVEDSLDIIELTRQYLQLSGFAVDAVTHAGDFWPQIAAHEYDVFLLDYGLPDSNGLDILKDLTARDVKTPAIIVTGRGDEVVAARTVQAGAAEYVIKAGNYLDTLPETITRVIDHARLRQALDEARDRYHDLFEHASDGILVCDMDGAILEANPTLCRWLNYPVDGLIGKDLDTLLCAEHPGAGSRLWPSGAGRELCERLIRQGVLMYEGAYRRRDGAALPVEVSARCVPSRGKGRPAFLQFFVRDITLRREMEAELLRRTRALAALNDITAGVTRSLDLKQVLDAALDGILTALEIDCGAIYLGSESFELAAVQGFSGVFSGEMRALSAAEWAVARPALVAAGKGETWAAREGVRAGLSHSLVSKGKRVGLIILASRERDSFSPDEIDFVSVNCDRIAVAVENAQLFRELQGSLEALRNAQTQLVRAARLSAVGELAAGVAHQINNPLTTIIADAQLLVRAVDSAHPAHSSASAIFQAGWRAQRVVQRLLNFSRPDEGEYAPTSVNDTLVNALDLVGAHVERGGVQLKLALAGDLPPIQANENQLEEVWINLLMNARDALSEQQPGFIALSSRLAPGGEAVEVEVSDNGRGIGEAERDQVFMPFFTTKGEGRGNGLGLSVSQTIVYNHGGEITFQSREGEGATFVVRLPLTRRE